MFFFMLVLVLVLVLVLLLLLLFWLILSPYHGRDSEVFVRMEDSTVSRQGESPTVLQN